jgi:hypothetical protein
MLSWLRRESKRALAALIDEYQHVRESADALRQVMVILTSGPTADSTDPDLTRKVRRANGLRISSPHYADGALVGTQLSTPKPLRKKRKMEVLSVISRSSALLERCPCLAFLVSALIGAQGVRSD